jgi:SAM-dependent methyltransferase
MTFFKNLLLSIKGAIIRRVIKKQLNNEFLGSDFGFSRGCPVDRFYIDQFFNSHRGVVTGVCLEFGDTSYIKKYGNAVSGKYTFNYSKDCSMTGYQLVGDVSKVEELPCEMFDCIVCVNVLNFIYDSLSSLRGLKKLLKPGGQIILTLAGTSAHISRYDMDRWGDYWRMTDKAAIKLAEQAGFQVLKVETYGNPYACSAQLNGFSVEDLTYEKILPSHPDYQLVVGLLLTKKTR